MKRSEEGLSVLRLRRFSTINFSLRSVASSSSRLWSGKLKVANLLYPVRFLVMLGGVLAVADRKRVLVIAIVLANSRARRQKD